MKIPNTKHQAPGKLQAPNAKRAAEQTGALELDVWNFSGAWCLVFGVFPPRSRRQGFTLIEVILAIGIFAIVLVAINTAFFAALRLRQHTSDALENALPLNRTLAVLRRDLQNAAPPGGVLAGDFRSSGPSATAGSKGAPSSIAGGQYGGLDFFTSTGPLSDDVPWGDIQEVNYQLMDPLDKVHFYGKDLVRSVTRNLLASSTQSADVQRLMSNVDSLDFFYFDGSQWRDTWDTSSGDTNLPRAVRVRLQMAVDPAAGNRAPEPLQMVVLLESQSSTNETQTATGGTQ